MLQARAFEKGQNLLKLRFSWPIKLRIFPHETTSWRDRLGCRRFQFWCLFCRNGLVMSQFKLRTSLKKCRKWFSLIPEPLSASRSNGPCLLNKSILWKEAIFGTIDTPRDRAGEIRTRKNSNASLSFLFPSHCQVL